MNKLLTSKKTMLTLTILLSFFSITANADTKYHKNELKVRTYDYKCHVNLLGGLDTVYFVNSSSTNLNEVGNSLVGKKVKLSFLKTPSKVYGVIECVELYDEFKSSASKLVDSKTVR